MRLPKAASAALLCCLLVCCSNMLNDQRRYAPEPEYAPEPIKLTSLSTGQDSIAMGWSDPADDNFEYVLVVCNGADTRIERGTGACTIAGLSGDTKYEVRITAYSRAGRGSDAVSFDACTTSSGTRTYHLVYTAEDMNSVRDDLAGYHLLMADISLSAYPNWTPIGTDSDGFRGAFDGQGHVISGLSINSPASRIQGLFGLSEGTIENTGLRDVSINGGNEVGGLVGWNAGTISNSYVTGSVRGDTYTGGLVGECLGSIINSYAAGSVSGNDFVGGLVGWCLGSIINSYAAGSVSGYNFVGGLVGECLGSIINTYAAGSVSGRVLVGGLVGSGPCVSSYYDSTTTGMNDTAHGTPLTTAQMKLKDSYAGWDFTAVWDISASVNDGYPYLRNNPPK